MTRGHCQVSNAGLAQVGEFRAANDPSRPMVRLTPKANDSSFPLNHLAIAVVIDHVKNNAEVSTTVADITSGSETASGSGTVS